MSESRHLTAWLLLGLLVVVGAGAAVLGVAQAPNDAALLPAVTNTVGNTKTHTAGAANFSESFTEVASVGKQSESLVFQAPDRIGGYQQSGNKRTYVYVIGKVAYESLTVAAKASTAHLTFYRQPLPAGESAKSFDPAHIYLVYARDKSVKDLQNQGSTHTFTITKSGQTGHFVYTVSGPYVSEFTLKVGAESVALSISKVGTSPPVALPAGAKVVAAPPTGASGASGAGGAGAAG
jgi:hypothetical protein